MVGATTGAGGGVQLGGGGVQKALPGRGGKRVGGLASARLLSLLEGFA